MGDPSQVRLIPDCRVSVDGKKLDTEKDAALTRVEVDLDVDLFGQCTLVFNDPQQKLINGKDFESGTAVKIEIGFASKLQKVFEGEVVALEPQFRRDSPPSLRVVCQESLHRLALSQMTRAFNDVDDKQIATRIAQEHGLSADAPSGTKEHVLQGNVTDAAFLRRLAQKHGNHLRIEGKKVIIGPPPSGASITVGPGDGLRKIKVRIQSNTQVEEISVHGYDPKTKQEFVGKAKGQGVVGEGTQKYGKGKTLSFAGHEHQPADQATAEAMAKGRMRKIAEGHVVATLETIGNPQMVPGATVKLEKMGAQIDGSYRVEKALHRFSKHGYYVNLKAVRVAKASPPAAKAAGAPAQTKAAAPTAAPAAGGAGGAQTQASGAAAQTPAAASAATAAAGTGAAPAQSTAGSGTAQAPATGAAGQATSAPATAATPQASLFGDANYPHAPDAAFNLTWKIANWAQGMTASIAPDQDIGDGKGTGPQDVTAAVQADGSGTLAIAPPSGGAFNVGRFEYLLTVTPTAGDPVKSQPVVVTVQAGAASFKLSAEGADANGQLTLEYQKPVTLNWKVTGAASAELTATANPPVTTYEGTTADGGKLRLAINLATGLTYNLTMVEDDDTPIATWEFDLVAPSDEDTSPADMAATPPKVPCATLRLQPLALKLDASGNGEGSIAIDPGPRQSLTFALSITPKDGSTAQPVQVSVQVTNFLADLLIDDSPAPDGKKCKLATGALADDSDAGGDDSGKGTATS